MRRWLLALALFALLGGVPPAAAGSEHERARSAVQAGELRPLGEVLARVRRRFPGRVLDARLEGGRGGRPWTYRVKVLTPPGRVLDVRVDAGSGRVLGAR